jgi:hypothetical protein
MRHRNACADIVVHDLPAGRQKDGVHVEVDG